MMAENASTELLNFLQKLMMMGGGRESCWIRIELVVPVATSSQAISLPFWTRHGGRFHLGGMSAV